MRSILLRRKTTWQSSVQTVETPLSALRNSARTAARRSCKRQIRRMRPQRKIRPRSLPSCPRQIMAHPTRKPRRQQRLPKPRKGKIRRPRMVRSKRAVCQTKRTRSCLRIAIHREPLRHSLPLRRMTCAIKRRRLDSASLNMAARHIRMTVTFPTKVSRRCFFAMTTG